MGNHSLPAVDTVTEASQPGRGGRGPWRLKLLCSHGRWSACVICLSAVCCLDLCIPFLPLGWSVVPCMLKLEVTVTGRKQLLGEREAATCNSRDKFFDHTSKTRLFLVTREISASDR